MSALPLFKPIAVCRRCLDRGFVNAREIPDAPNRPGCITAATMFERGVACDCPYGAEFAERQMEWLKPIPEGRTRQQQQVREGGD